MKKLPSRNVDFRNLMREVGLSGVEFARRIGVTPGTVSAWMTGKSKPPGAAVAYLELLDKVRRLNAEP